MINKKSILIFTIICSLILFSSCTATVDTIDSENTVEVEDNSDTETAETEEEETFAEKIARELEESDVSAEIGTEQTVTEILAAYWQNQELTSLLTDSTFTIKGLRDETNKAILLETFAVWCPTCTKQQQEIKELHDEVGDTFISISLNVDPNEDAEIIIDHATENGFDWYYAISPTDLTNKLIDTFGITIASAPQAPVILICADGSHELLDNGLKKVDELKEALESCN
ncbi:hypothetical protein HOA92_04785 [archaeon]|nr:hypothetical protein [archaeon]